MAEEIQSTHYVVTYTIERVDMVTPKKDTYDKTVYEPKRKVTRIAQNTVKSTLLDRVVEVTGRHLALVEDIEDVIDPVSPAKRMQQL